MIVYMVRDVLLHLTSFGQALGMQDYRIVLLYPQALVISVSTFFGERKTLSPLSASTQLCHWLKKRELVTRACGYNTSIR